MIRQMFRRVARVGEVDQGHQFRRQRPVSAGAQDLGAQATTVSRRVPAVFENGVQATDLEPQWLGDSGDSIGTRVHGTYAQMPPQ